MSTSEVMKVQDRAAFTGIVERHRRELQVHCYRMLGSFEESEDLVQETFLRAWRRRDSFEGRSTLRTWLYRIATNACLDALQRRPAGKVIADGPEIAWLEPFPDRLLEQIPAQEAGPDAEVVSKETIELAFLVAIQHLPPKQRAVLILRDVLGWSAKETGSLMEASVASVNSALQRARATMKQQLPERRLEWGAEASQEERALLDRYLEATEEQDMDAFVEMLRDDARFSMPPEPGVWVGAETIVQAWMDGGAGDPEKLGHMRGVVTRANRQPAVACYVKKPGMDHYRPMALDVLVIEDGQVAEIVTFPPSVFPNFDLPERL